MLKLQTKVLTPKQAGLGDREPGTYWVNEVFFSIQGEGCNAGIPMVFVRFSKCNLCCRVPSAGFHCDTDFDGYEVMSVGGILQRIERAYEHTATHPQWVLLTGGEPTLQVDDALLDALHSKGFCVAMESNGTNVAPTGIEWVCVSPKSAIRTLAHQRPHELKIVVTQGAELPDPPPLLADNYVVSPAFEVDGSMKPGALQWCVELVKRNPLWRLSVQQHKQWRVR